MCKRVAMFAMAILVLILPGCGNTQAVCKQLVLDFTESESVRFVETIGQANEELAGDCVFEDELFQYTVDPAGLYICRIDMKPEPLAEELAKPEKVSDDSAERIALDIFNKVLSEFLVEDGEVTALYASPAKYEGGDTMDVQERIDGVPTGNRARIHLSKSRVFLDGVFHTGSFEQAKSAQMISVETAEQIALEQARGMKEINAENMKIDESEPSELMGLKDMAVWAVRIAWSDSDGFAYGSLVMVDAYSGEVFRVYFCA